VDSCGRIEPAIREKLEGMSRKLRRSKVEVLSALVELADGKTVDAIRKMEGR
jgi:hypothetical protein